jgi:hypothetical protein
MPPVSISSQTEAVMSTSIPKQHPAVVLRSQYDHLRAFLALICVLVVALSAAIVVVAVNDEDPTVVAAPKSAPAAAVQTGSTVTSPSSEIRLRRSGATVFVPNAQRYDGGPDEGTRGPSH